MMVLVRVDMSEASSVERSTLAPLIRALQDAGAKVVVTDQADLVKQTRASLVERFKQMGLTAGEPFGEREKVLMSTTPFTPRERESFAAAMTDLVKSGFFDIDERGRLRLSRAGQAEMYPVGSSGAESLASAPSPQVPRLEAGNINSRKKRSSAPNSLRRSRGRRTNVSASPPSP